MAKLKPVRIDGETVSVDARSRLLNVVPAEVTSVRTDRGELVTRDKFAQVPIPDGWESNLSAINKGGRPTATRQPVIIDGTYEVLPASAQLNALVPADVRSVRTLDGRLIQRKDLARTPIPAGWESNLSAINKGRRTTRRPR